MTPDRRDAGEDESPGRRWTPCDRRTRLQQLQRQVVDVGEDLAQLAWHGVPLCTREQATVSQAGGAGTHAEKQLAQLVGQLFWGSRAHAAGVVELPVSCSVASAPSSDKIFAQMVEIAMGGKLLNFTEPFHPLALHPWPGPENQR